MLGGFTESVRRSGRPGTGAVQVVAVTAPPGAGPQRLRDREDRQDRTPVEDSDRHRCGRVEEVAGGSGEQVQVEGDRDRCGAGKAQCGARDQDDGVGADDPGLAYRQRGQRAGPGRGAAP